MKRITASEACDIVFGAPAYDYEAQEWVDAATDRAANLHRKHATEEVEILTGPGSLGYLMLTGASRTDAEARLHNAYMVSGL